MAVITEEELRSRWRKESPIYKTWGEYVACQIKKALTNSGHTPDDIIKIMEKRIKTSNSFVDKALHREKEYKNPYDDVTDKIGLRYVVETGKHIGCVKCAIEDNSDLWGIRVDRAVSDNRANKPEEFLYESDHFILTNKREICWGQKTIPGGITCEVQIRTLLQHAISSWDHVYYYKEEVISAEIRRNVILCRAMGFAIENMQTKIEKDIKKKYPTAKTYHHLKKFYCDKICETFVSERSGKILMRVFEEKMCDWDSVEKQFLQFTDNHGDSFIEEIKNQKKHNRFFGQPIVLFVYFMVANQPEYVKENWPINSVYLEKIFSFLGISYDAT